MRQLKVFIVEDNAIEIGGFIAMSEEFGFVVIGCANDGEDAIKQVCAFEEKPDVILMDVNLPKLDGLSAANQLASLCDTPIVIVTGYKPDTAMTAESSDNIFGYIQKPVDPYELGASIKIAYNRSEESKKILQELDRKKKELEDRKIIERAKGVIMRINACSEQEAMQRLQKKSRDSNCKLIEIAKAVVESSKNLYMI